MIDDLGFESTFEVLTGNCPFPWQTALFERMRQNDFPQHCDIPTGLGKTAVIPIWLIALATCPDKIPRRLVYVVNRRTVVDQATREAEKLQERLKKVPDLIQRLERLCAIPSKVPLAISTLRGQFADNREWSADPARPAVIVGTVDMIGSRLLFGGYRIGFKTRPMHAGFLGQDALLVHDEAHLEPAFHELLVAIKNEQKRCNEFGLFRVMELSATSRGQDESLPLQLTPADYDNGAVKKRIEAMKTIELHPLIEEKKLAKQIAELALKHKGSNSAVLVFVRTVEDVEKIATRLEQAEQQFKTLTGTLRGWERDELIRTPVFIRFMPKKERAENVGPAEGTVYLVCTSAGEVGVNISADHLVGDLTTFESTAQRFGRVNRFGERDDTRIDVVFPKSFGKGGKIEEYDQRRLKTLELLRKLNGDASPMALGKLNQDARLEAYAPIPTILPVSDILFDSWSLTTIRDKLPGRPLVEPYLHGLSEWEPPQTHVAWRGEVYELDPREKLRSGPLFHDDDERRAFEQYARELLEDYPLKPHELLRDSTFRKNSGIQATLAQLAAGREYLPVWVQDMDGAVSVMTLADLADAALGNRTVILPPQAGGLAQQGMLTAVAYDPSRIDYDVADEWRNDDGQRRRVRVWNDDPEFDKKIAGMRLVRRIDFPGDEEDEDAQARSWSWYVRPWSADDDGSKSAKEAVTWQDHTDDVVRNVERIVAALQLPRELQDAIHVAATFHDLGKKREVWQRSIGNLNPQVCYAKSGKDWRRRDDLCPNYRHEFGSLLDLIAPEQTYQAELDTVSDGIRDLVVHLIAAHHGRARPHFPADEVLDPTHPEASWHEMARTVPQRFARLQRKYGRWGLAYLESLLRAADWAASAEPFGFFERQELFRETGAPAAKNKSKASIRIKVDVTNPGQFFGCCGLLELADRLWPGAEGWFQCGTFQITCEGTLYELLARVVMDPPTELTTLDNGLPVKRIIAPLRFTFDGGASYPLTLDAWTDIRVEKKKPAVVANRPWNFWSGNQKSFEIWTDLRLALAKQIVRCEGMNDENLFRDRVPMTGRFGFDSGAAWNALDVGFSPNTQQMAVASSPATEILAAVGIQRFRPLLSDDRKSFLYATWGQPLPPCVASAAASTLLLVEPMQRFRGRVFDRGQYAALGYSFPLNGGSNE